MASIYRLAVGPGKKKARKFGKYCHLHALVIMRQWRACQDSNLEPTV